MAGFDSIPGYYEHLQTIHSFRSVSQETLDDCIRQVSPAGITQCKKIMEGETNEVYDVELADGLAVIVRIARSSRSVFDREHWAIESCLAKGIPVPEILSISRHDTEPEPIDACIQKKITGCLLTRYEGSEQDKSQIVRQCGDWLREMHTIKTTGYGYIDGNGRGMYESAREEVVEYESLEKGLMVAADAHGLERSLLLDALVFVVEMIETREVEPCFLHNDFEPKHVLVDKGAVVAIIDFGESSSGDPVNDLVRFSFCESGQLRFEDLLAGYGECDLKRLLGYRIGFGLFMVAGCHAKGFTEGVFNGMEKVQQDWQRVQSNNSIYK